MITIRAGRGLGDSLYLQSVVRHLMRNGERFRIHSDWPDVFRMLAPRAKVVPFSRVGISILAHYTQRKAAPNTSQFEDVCLSAGILEPVELKLDWPSPDSALTRRVLESGKPVLCVQLPRSPMGRTDGFGSELLPDCVEIQRLIDQVNGRATVVQIGAGRPLYQFKGIDIDLANRTTVAEMLDVASVAHSFLGYCSFIVPLAESLDKPALLVWSRKGLRSQTPYVRQITPEKVLHKASSRYVVDDEPMDGMIDAIL